MNIIADNSINKELIGGEAWFGKICEQLAENYINPNQRFENIKKTNGFIQDGLSFKPLDRTQVRSRDLVLEDGQSYDQYYDPFLLSARHIVSDIDSYSLNIGNASMDFSSLKVSIPNL